MKKTLLIVTQFLIVVISVNGYAVDTWDDYATYGQRKAAVIYNGASPMAQWATNPNPSDNTISVIWGDPLNWNDSVVEEHEIKYNCAGGNDMVWINAYRNDKEGYRWPISTTKAVYIDATTGQSFDITSGGTCGTDGQPYAIYNVYNSPYIIQVWGNIYDINGNVGKRFFWEHKIIPYQQVTNNCWAGSGSNTRTAIRQDEAWWDSENGWLIGSGDMGSNGEPSGNNVSYSHYQTIAKGLGYAWTTGDYGVPNSYDACMKYQWSW